MLHFVHAMDDAGAAKLEDEILALLIDSKRIEAVKLCRERTGLGLKEAKDAVDAIEAGRHGVLRGLVRPPAEPAGPLDADLLHLLRAGRKIEAIKLCKERSGLGLKEAKESVERLAARHGIVLPPGGCLALLVPFLLR